MIRWDRSTASPSIDRGSGFDAADPGFARGGADDQGAAEGESQQGDLRQLSVIAENSDHMPASLVNAAVAAVRKTDLLTDWSIAQGQRVMAAATPADVFKAWRDYRTDDVSPRVPQNVLLMAGAKDHYMPLHMLPDQLMTLTAAHSVTARIFTEAESAQNHCQIGNMGLALTVMLDWLDQTGGRIAESRTIEPHL